MRASNFKGWEALDWFRLAPLTVLFGANSSGKTSLLQMLLLLKQTAESADRRIALHFGDKTTPVELGTFRDVVFDHDTEREVEVGLHWDLDYELQIVDPQTDKAAFSTDHLRFETAVGLLGGEPEARWIKYGLEDVSFGLERLAKSDEFGATVEPSKRWHFDRRSGRPSTVPGPVRFYGFPPVITGNFTNAWFLADLELELEALFSRIRYLGPLRDDQSVSTRGRARNPRMWGNEASVQLKRSWPRKREASKYERDTSRRARSSGSRGGSLAG
jgi:hypothetical protein